MISSHASFSLPNAISSFRLLLGLVIPALILRSASGTVRWAQAYLITAFILFTVGALTDFWDGWLARRRHEETPIGRILDPVADKVFVLGIMTSFAFIGVYSYWYLVPIFLRELAVTFCRFVWLSQGQAIGAERGGKVKLVLQILSICVSFAFLAFPRPWLLSSNHVFLTLALSVTLYSGFTFLNHNRALLRERNFARRVAGLGVGHLKPFPGTYGSLLGLAAVGVVGFDPRLHLLVLVTFILLGYYAIGRMHLAKEEDPLEVVIDEFCGILFAFFWVPFHWKTALLGFLAFRFFDVTKIFPIGWLENRKGAHGIMLDDLGAGVYTWLVLRTFF